MIRALVERRQLRGPSGNQVRARRRAANAFAVRFIIAVKAAFDGMHPEFVIEACRMMIRALTAIIEDRGDAGRALGVLNGAGLDLAPTYRGEGHGARADADALFAEAGAVE